MNTNSDPSRCSKCGARIPMEAPQGLCPQCVLAAAAGAADAAEAAAGPAAGLPGLEEVQAAFPQLEIVERIGAGGMGVVYQARQPKLDRLVALKLLSERLSRSPAFAERFQREARALARLAHPNIVAIYDFGESGGFCYLMMEFVEGVNLRQAMRAGRFSPAEALAIVPRICEALQYAHEQGILHRDIKPENILIDTRGRVKIADFGIAKLVGDPQADGTLTGTGVALGTPHYMAPEQIDNPATVDQRADVYSLGVVFYEMLTGELPLGRFAPPSAKTPVDSRVDAIVFRALEREREKRFQTAGEVKTRVEDVAAATPAVPIPAVPSCLDPGAGPVPLQIRPEHQSLVLLGLALALGFLFIHTLPLMGVVIGTLAGAKENLWELAYRLLAAGAGGALIGAAWQYRQRLLAPLGIANTAVLGPDLPRAGWSTDRLLGTAAVATLLLLTVQVAVHAMVLISAAPSYVQTAGWASSVVLVGGAALLAAWGRAVTSRHVGPPAPPPRWMRRIGFWFLILGGVAGCPTLIAGSESLRVWSAGALLAVTGVALLLRSRPWRVVALGVNAVLGILALSQVALTASLIRRGTLPALFVAGAAVPAEWRLALATIHTGLFILGLWVLCRKDVRASFGLAATSAPGPDPVRPAAS